MGGETALMGHWGLLRSELVWAYDRPLDTRSGAWRYSHDPTPAWLIRRGRVVLEFHDGVESYEEGTWLFPRQAEGVQRFSKEAHLLSLRFYAEWPDGKPIFPREKTLAVPAAAAPELTRAAEVLAAHVAGRFRQRGQPSDLAGSLGEYFELQPLFFSWLGAYHATLTRRGIQPQTLGHLHEKVRLALHCLNTQPLLEPMPGKRLARQVGLSVSQLNKIFSREVGTTPAAFWDERRLRAARSRLLAGAESIKTIAYGLGFSAPANFSQWFRAHTGQAPRDYRRANAAAPRI